MWPEVVPGEVVSCEFLSGEVVSESCVAHHLILAFTEEHIRELRIHEGMVVTEITSALIMGSF